MNILKYGPHTITIAGIALVLLAVLPRSGAFAASWWQSSVNLESKVGTDRAIQSLDLMYPLAHTEDSLTFADLRGRVDDNQSVEVNLGLAHRFTTENPLDGVVPGVGASNEAVLGYYGFADRLESQYDNTFYQATAGAEYFTKDYSLRVNGYLPENEREPTTTFTQLQATGTQIFFEDRHNYERPLPGYDVELGRTFRFDGWQAYGRGSYFRFHHSDATEVEGSRFRTGIQFDGSHPEVYLPEDSQLTIGVEWQEDNIREEQTFGVMRMRIPFGSPVESRESRVESQNKTENPDSRLQTQDSRLSAWKKDRLTERIERDVDIVTGEDEGTEPTGDTQPAELVGTDRPLDSVGLAQAGESGAGTVLDPGSLASAVNTAGTDGAVFVLGELRASSVVLPEGQTLLGGDAPLIESEDGTVRVALDADGNDPKIEGTSGRTSVQFDTGTTGQSVRSLVFAGGKTALRGQNTDDVTIEDVTVKNTGDDAVVLDESKGVTVQNNTIEGTLSAGDNFEGTVASSQVGTLSFGDTADARVANVTVTGGDLTSGKDAGRGSGNRFALEDVEVASGDLQVGDNAGSEEGTLRMDTVTVEDGFLELGDHTGGDPSISNDGGMATLTNITTGDTLSIGDNAGYDGGSFTMEKVESGGTLEIDSSAGAFDGTFRMTDVSSDGGLDIGDYAGEDGTFEMEDVATEDSFTVGDGAGRNSGAFEMSKVEVVSGDLQVGDNAGAREGTLRMDTVTVEDGFLELGDHAGGDPSSSYDGGTATLTNITTRALEIGGRAGAFDGTFRMTDVSSDGGLDIGDYAGEDGTFTMENVESGGTLDIGDYAGAFDGTFTMENVESGGTLEIGDSAGSSDGTFTMEKVESGGTLDIGIYAGSFNGTFTIGNSVVEGDLSGSYAGISGGSFNLLSNGIDGDLDFNGTMDRCSGNDIIGSISTDASSGGCP